MGAIFAIQGILIYIYAFDHNPPHIHVRSGDGKIMEIWNKAQNGQPIEKIKR